MIHRCENCERVLEETKIVWLELSQTDGKYYLEIPKGHVSQGGFAFGAACAAKEINK